MNPKADHSQSAADSAGDTTAAQQAELAAQKDRYLRLAADFDNYRKRTAQEAEPRAAAQKETFIRDLLPAIDNLERALSSSASADQLREGVQITLRQLQQLLRRHGIEPEESLGTQFDPNRHEALRTAYDPSQPDHAVVDVFERGYRRGEAMFRPARVVVNSLSQPEGASHAG